MHTHLYIYLLGWPHLASVLEKMHMVKDNRMMGRHRKGKEITKQNQGKERTENLYTEAGGWWSVLEDSSVELVKQFPQLYKDWLAVFMGPFLHLKLEKEHSVWCCNYNRVEKFHHLSAVMRILIITLNGTYPSFYSVEGVWSSWASDVCFHRHILLTQEPCRCLACICTTLKVTASLEFTL